ncbi:MAG: hypothetical protein ABJA62_08000 [Luteimonas sp.]
MHSFRRPSLVVWLAIAMSLACAAAWADPPQDRGHGRSDHGRQDADMQRDSMQRDSMQRDDRGGLRLRNDDALSDSVRRIERSTRSQVLSAERMQSDGRDVNRIKVVDDRGRVRVYMDDPQRGAPQPPPRPSPPTRDNDD